MINDSIRSMITAYTGTFSEKFWLGKDPSLWPHPDSDSPEGHNYLQQLDRLRHGLEWSIDDLRSLIKTNDQLRQQIEILREQLYSGSSVKENRLAIEQGENIKILTGVSMLFLPLSFVTVSKPKLIIIPVDSANSLTLSSCLIVGFWYADVHNSSNRLAFCGHHDRSMCTIFYLDIRPTDTCRYEFVSKTPFVHQVLPRKMEAEGRFPP